jgi:hypothetical protein
MKVKVEETSGVVLDWLVAKCEDASILTCATGEPTTPIEFAGHHDAGWANYSTDWSLCGPIVEREGIATRRNTHGLWYALPSSLLGDRASAHWNKEKCCTGPTPVIAAMRRYVASKLGNEVEAPEELV